MKRKEKPSRCKTCGKPCYGRMCNSCFHEGSRYQLSRHYNYEKKKVGYMEMSKLMLNKRQEPKSVIANAS